MGIVGFLNTDPDHYASWIKSEVISGTSKKTAS
jgi:hypothetical protein